MGFFVEATVREMLKEAIDTQFEFKLSIKRLIITAFICSLFIKKATLRTLIRKRQRKVSFVEIMGECEKLRMCQLYENFFRFNYLTKLKESLIIG